MAKVTGIGGVFFKSTNDHKKLAEWYSQNLGIQLEPWGGAILKWTEDKSEDRGLTVWHVAEKTSEWFSPSPSTFMINYRIDNMSEMLAQLKQNGVANLEGPRIPRERKLRMGARSRRKQSRTLGADGCMHVMASFAEYGDGRKNFVNPASDLFAGSHRRRRGSTSPGSQDAARTTAPLRHWRARYRRPRTRAPRLQCE